MVLYMIKICSICNQEYENRDKRSKHCTNDDCRKEYNRLKYKIKKYNKKCRDCKKEFTGTQKEILCKDCKKNINKKFKKVKIESVCKYCGKLLFIKEKNITKTPVNEKKYTCNNCKNVIKKRLSKRMKIYNPMFNEETRLKNTKHGKKSKFRKILTKEEISERMKIYNPMFNEETRKKVRNTIKRKIESGEIVYKKGKDHHS
jgi:hypothetical protein